MNQKANQAAAGKGGFPSLFHAGRSRPALPEQQRWDAVFELGAK